MTDTMHGGTGGASSRRPINFDDVDDIIGVASELQELERDRLSVEDLRAVARDLDIPEHLLQPAIAELDRRRQATLAAEAERRRRRQRVQWVSAGVAAVIAVWALSGNARLGALGVEVDRARAQWVSVQERQVATEKQWRGQPDSPGRMAELSGAENRVRVERKRYDEAASAYNEAAAGFPSSLWRNLFGHPERRPLSDALSRGEY
jgi:hypothetical protein